MLNPRLALPAILFTCALGFRALAAEDSSPSPADPQAAADAFEAKLGYTQGTVELKGGLAKLEVPASFRFVPPDGAKRLLVNAWRNPPGSADGVLGMLVPADVSPLSKGGWGVVITYDEDGFVDDKDAAKIDYDKLLKGMQDETLKVNEERKQKGFPTAALIGWAERPTYDSATHVLYWAKELAFSGDDHHTLNYNVRVLGRRGVLVLNAVASMSQLDAIRPPMKDVLGFVEFHEGNRYTDFIRGKDKVAAYGIAGLVAGAVAAKAGLFKLLLVALLGAKKLVLVALAAIGAFFKKIFGGQSLGSGKKDKAPEAPTSPPASSPPPPIPPSDGPDIV